MLCSLRRHDALVKLLMFLPPSPLTVGIAILLLAAGTGLGRITGTTVRASTVHVPQNLLNLILHLPMHLIGTGNHFGYVKGLPAHTDVGQVGPVVAQDADAVELSHRYGVMERRSADLGPVDGVNVGAAVQQQRDGLRLTVPRGLMERS